MSTPKLYWLVKQPDDPQPRMDYILTGSMKDAYEVLYDCFLGEEVSRSEIIQTLEQEGVDPLLFDELVRVGVLNPVHVEEEEA